MEPNRNYSAAETDLIRAKAYELWKSQGCRDGVAIQNWLDAERLVKSKTAEPDRGISYAQTAAATTAYGSSSQPTVARSASR